jgi:hypothetical protein
MTKVARYTAPLWNKDVVIVTNDCTNFTTAQDGWTSLAADAGSSVVAADARAGNIVLTTGATLNNEVALRTTQAVFQFADGKGLLGLARIQWAEAATNAGNIFVGFASTFGADLIVDGGTSMRTTGCEAGVYKLAGATVWRATARNGTSVMDGVSTKTAGQAAYQEVEVLIEDWYDGEMELGYRVDGDYLVDANGFALRHRVNIAAALVMHFGVYAKAGAATSEVVNVDWLYAHQYR